MSSSFLIMQYHVQRGVSGRDSWVDWLSVDIKLSVWFLEMQNVSQNTIKYHVLRWREINKWIMDLFCKRREWYTDYLLSTFDEIFVFDVFSRCRIYPFLFRWLFFLCVTVWCLMIVVFCHIRLYILDLGISFHFFSLQLSQITAFWKKK